MNFFYLSSHSASKFFPFFGPLVSGCQQLVQQSSNQVCFRQQYIQEQLLCLLTSPILYCVGVHEQTFHNDIVCGLGIFVKFVYLFSIGKFDCNCLYYKTLYTSVILLPEDGLWNKSKVLAMNLRTFYLALMFITHFCLHQFVRVLQRHECVHFEVRSFQIVIFDSTMVNVEIKNVTSTGITTSTNVIVQPHSQSGAGFSHVCRLSVTHITSQIIHDIFRIAMY